ncbi:cyclic nucleotide-gated ion channel 1-like [Dorcoceras hygrometricum]|uniref:Cyclic nucleotide-gated ion channel 1-like n=1 Tax=Dorcoceras hygrometricum TaxID=472368 RepID=A0A2Z6ZUH4_9LAMI|nr:cyclic nucleotide-gated ion channel 1-like [Dorcoceras hygrometricum]
MARPPLPALVARKSRLLRGRWLLCAHWSRNLPRVGADSLRKTLRELPAAGRARKIGRCASRRWPGDAVAREGLRLAAGVHKSAASLRIAWRTIAARHRPWLRHRLAHHDAIAPRFSRAKFFVAAPPASRRSGESPTMS